MPLLSPLKLAYHALKLHKVRSALTVLGLLIGVMSIIVVMNLGQGLKGLILDYVKIFGSDYLQVETKVPSTGKNSSDNATNMAQGVTVTTLKLKDAEEVGKHPNVRGYYAGQMGQAVVAYGDTTKTSLLWGISNSFFNLSEAKVLEGREFIDDEDKSEARVAVIGATLKEKLFGSDNALEQYIKIGQRNFRVVGVLERQGGSMFFDMDSIVFMPVRTLQKQILGIDYIQFFTVYLKDAAQAYATAADIEDILREEHKITDPKKDDFSVTTMDEAMDMLNTITGGITLLLSAIAAISLLVGGVGIMNIMYVSVTERTYEIGLRKAVGATNKNILWQFLWEAIFLTFLGGLIGVVLGTIFSFFGALAAASVGFNLGLNFSPVGFILGTGFSVLVGLIFGVYPARKAAQMDPVEALRQE